MMRREAMVGQELYIGTAVYKLVQSRANKDRYTLFSRYYEDEEYSVLKVGTFDECYDILNEDYIATLF